MNFRNFSPRIRIFFSMMLLILLTYVLIAFTTVYQYKQQTTSYNNSRFERKEDATRLNITYTLNETKLSLRTDQLISIFESRIYQIASVHKVSIKIFDLQGDLLLSSEPTSKNDMASPDSLEVINYDDLLQLRVKKSHRLIQGIDADGKRLQSSFTYLYNEFLEPIGIIQLHYLQDNSAQDRNLKEFLMRLGLVYLVMFILAISFAYFLSSYITRSLKTIVDKIGKTGLRTQNKKIVMGNASVEIKKLVFAYNNMIDQLEESAEKLVASEREQAWREMAKQVAHEIKNPLTPMRLSVQSFERRFDPLDPKIKEKLREYSETLIQQIDVMSSIASAFSDFAQMPTQKRERLEVVSVIKMTLDIFAIKHIQYTSNVEESYVDIDKSQLVRVVTNIVKNAIQATQEIKKPKIDVSFMDAKDSFEIVVTDNGIGIEEGQKPLIFEPRFTTKSSGMGLGLAMSQKIIETYEGTIQFTSTLGKGTSFRVHVPKDS